MNVKYTKEILEPLVVNSTSVVDVMRKLNVKFTGGNHSHISRRIKWFGIDTSHFKGQGSNLGKPSSNKKSWRQILILRNSNRRQEAWKLRRALIEYGREYECEECKLNPEWNGKELRLQVDHKNKNWLDDRPENLRFLCPNCHSQTEGYGGSKGNTDFLNRNRYFRTRCRNVEPKGIVGSNPSTSTNFKCSGKNEKN